MFTSKLLFALVASALVLFFLPSAPAQAADCYKIATTAGTGGTGEIAQIARHVFEAAGLCVEMIRLPPKRIEAMAELRQVDGWVQAISAADIPRGMILVPHDLGHLEGTLYWASDVPEPTGSRAVIGVVLGQTWAQGEVSRRRSKLYEVRDNKQLLSMAVEQRIQGFLVPAITYRHFLAKFPELRGYRSRFVSDLPIRLALNAGLESVAQRLDIAAEQTMTGDYPAQVWGKYLQELPPEVH